MTDEIKADSLTGELPSMVSVDSVNELQADFNHAIDKFMQSNNEVPLHICAATTLHTMLLFPWVWIVERAKRTPDEYVQFLNQEINIFKNAVLANPLSIDNSNFADDEVSVA
jgi:hypothetical protein